MDKREEAGFLVSRGVKIGLGVAAVATVLTGVAYFFFQRDQANQSQRAPANQSQIQSGSSALKPGNISANTSTSTHTGNSRRLAGGNDPRYENTIYAIDGMVKKDLEDGMLGTQTIMAINQAMTLIAEKPYAAAVLQNRTERRAVRTSNPEKYCSLVEQGTYQIEQAINDSLNKVLTDVGCTLQQYEHSNEVIARSNPQFPLMSLLMIERMKSNIPSNRDLSGLTGEKAKEMIKFQIESYPNIDIKASNSQLNALVKQSYMGDMTFEKFGYEEEDFAQLSALGQDPEFQSLVRELQGLIQSDAMQAMGGGDFGGMPGMGGMY